MADELAIYDEAAKSALALADHCEAMADLYDEEWRRACMADAERHRERAAWYLERKALLEMPVAYAPEVVEMIDD